MLLQVYYILTAYWAFKVRLHQNHCSQRKGIKALPSATAAACEACGIDANTASAMTASTLLGQVYYVYGFALLVTFILLIVVVCVSIVGERCATLWCCASYGI